MFFALQLYKTNTVMNSSNVPLQLHCFLKAFPQMSQVNVFSQMNSDHMMPKVHFLYQYSSTKLDAFSVCVYKAAYYFLFFCAFFEFLGNFTKLSFKKH